MGGRTARAHRLAELCKSTQQAGVVPSVPAALLRRVVGHKLLRPNSPLMLDVVSAVVPRNLRLAGSTVAVDLFNALTDLALLHGSVPESFLGCLDETTRGAIARHPVHGHLKAGELLELVVRELTSGRKFGAEGLLRLVARVLREGHRLGTDAPEVIAAAMRAAAWLASSHSDVEMALDAMAVANARHGGELVDASTNAWLEARRALDSTSTHGAAGDPRQRRQARKERGERARADFASWCERTSLPAQGRPVR